MPVIINEFEVVVEPPPAPTPPPTPAERPEEAGRAPAALSPEAIERILEYFAERRARLLAD